MLSSRLLSLSDLVEVGLVEAGFSSLLVCVGGGCSGTVKNIQVLSNIVTVYIHPRQVGKLNYKWLGPYRITHSIGRGIYRLQLIADPKKTVNRVNSVQLKAYKMVSYV